MIRKNKKRIDPRYFLHETALTEQFSDDEVQKLLSSIGDCKYGNKEFNKAIGSLAGHDFEYGVEGEDQITYTINFKAGSTTLNWIRDVIKRAGGKIWSGGLDERHEFWKYNEPQVQLRHFQGSFNFPTEEEHEQQGAAGSMVLVIKASEFENC